MTSKPFFSDATNLTPEEFGRQARAHYMQTEAGTCEVCIYWRCDGDLAAWKTRIIDGKYSWTPTGKCHRYPETRETVFDHWCGEYKQP